MSKTNKELIMSEIKNNGMLLSFDHMSTPFWLTRSVSNIQGQNIQRKYVEKLLDEEIVFEIYKIYDSWIEEISKGKDEWLVDFEHKDVIKNLGLKISRKYNIKVFINKLNNIRNEHYEKVEL